jgi:hypothetical protein
MSGKGRSLLLAFCALSVWATQLQSSQAALRFGRKQEIHKVSDVPLQVEKGEVLYLGYTTTIHYFGAGILVEDGGYVLGVAGDEHRCYVMPEGDELKRLQAVRLLPDPLPKYHLGVWDYLDGFSLWIIIAVGLMVSGGTKLRKQSALNRASAADPVGSEFDQALVEGKIIPLTSLAPLPFLTHTASSRILNGLCVLCERPIDVRAKAFCLVGRYETTGEPEVKFKIYGTEVRRECVCQICYVPICTHCFRLYSTIDRWAQRIAVAGALGMGFGIITGIVMAVLDFLEVARFNSAVGLPLVLISLLGLVTFLGVTFIVSPITSLRRVSSRVVHIAKQFSEFGLPNTAQAKFPQWATVPFLIQQQILKQREHPTA